MVSIHQNSYHEESVSGGQVFYYWDSVKGKVLMETAEKVQLCPWRTEPETSRRQMAIIIFFVREMSDRDRGVRV